MTPINHDLDPNDIFISEELEAILTFAEIADEFCEWVEMGPEDYEDEIYSALNLLSSLYQQILALPEVEPHYEDIDLLGLHHRDAPEIIERFDELPFHRYQSIIDPLAEKEQLPERRDIRIDLKNIYLEIKEGLDLYMDGKRSSAVFHWTASFAFQWGRHVVDAQKALHAFLAKT
ncbi:MAG: DUF5063 domain-containing protein [Proteobacteria bacterium]|jgi:hypothetical protein|nr:DUF5063 domain-containing protein [Pseudomonadota bacterium]MBU1639547.1 DUF5063 domain-containing protein [Pseudomonadota bacterium]